MLAILGRPGISIRYGVVKLQRQGMKRAKANTETVLIVRQPTEQEGPHLAKFYTTYEMLSSNINLKANGPSRNT
jgi:hypothetical protein